jgi:hypothetical protein
MKTIVIIMSLIFSSASFGSIISCEDTIYFALNQKIQDEVPGTDEVVERGSIRLLENFEQEVVVYAATSGLPAGEITFPLVRTWEVTVKDIGIGACTVLDINLISEVQ